MATLAKNDKSSQTTSCYDNNLLWCEFDKCNLKHLPEFILSSVRLIIASSSVNLAESITAIWVSASSFCSISSRVVTTFFPTRQKTYQHILQAQHTQHVRYFSYLPLDRALVVKLFISHDSQPRDAKDVRIEYNSSFQNEECEGNVMFSRVQLLMFERCEYWRRSSFWI